MRNLTQTNQLQRVDIVAQFNAAKVKADRPAGRPKSTASTTRTAKNGGGK